MPQSSYADLAIRAIFMNDLHKNEESILKATDDTVMIAILCKYCVGQN